MAAVVAIALEAVAGIAPLAAEGYSKAPVTAEERLLAEILSSIGIRWLADLYQNGQPEAYQGV